MWGTSEPSDEARRVMEKYGHRLVKRNPHPHCFMQMDPVDGSLTHWCECGWIISTDNTREEIARGKAEWEAHTDA